MFDISEDAKLILDIAGVIITAVDSDLNLILINRSGCEILECDDKNVTGKNWLNSFIPDDEIERVKDFYEEIFKKGSGTREKFKCTVSTGNGNHKIIEWESIPIKDGNGDIVAVLSSGVDRTEQINTSRELEVCENRFSTLLDIPSICIRLIGKDGKLIQVSKGSTLCYGDSAEHINGMHLKEITHPDDYDKEMQLLTALFNGELENYTTERRCLSKKGDVRWGSQHVSIIPGGDSGKGLAISFCRNITKSKELENEVVKLLIGLLTQKEVEILKFLSEGMSRREIAKSMNIADATYDKHIQNIKKKLKKNTTFELFQFASDFQDFLS